MFSLKNKKICWISIVNLILMCISEGALNPNENFGVKGTVSRLNGISSFNCRSMPQISRYPHPTDCSKFFYCISGEPYQAQCYPRGSRFNPVSTRCDLPPEVPCGLIGPIPSNQIIGIRPPIVNTPVATTTTSTSRPSQIASKMPQPVTTTLTTKSPLPSRPTSLFPAIFPPLETTLTTTKTPTSFSTLLPSSTTPTLTSFTITPSPENTTPSTEPVQFTTIAPIDTPSTTQKPPRLNDKFEFTLDCSKVPCGLYPNHNGDCSSYIMCANGVQSVKECHGGLLFDTRTSECIEPEKALCWEEPNNGPFRIGALPPSTCPFHNFTANTEFETTTDGIILENPQVTNWGNWLPWRMCPPQTYVRGVNAWRRILKHGANVDQAGLISIALNCEYPDGRQEVILENLAPGVPNDGWPNFYRCAGSAVGFRLNSQRDQGPWPNDNLATDNVQLSCSCGPPAYKPYEDIPGEQTGNRGDWTKPQFCKAKQAVCGLQTQFADYREAAVGQYDNTGLNNMKIKCCDVPSPATTCEPSESTVLIRSCTNTFGIYPSRCDFQPQIGTTFDFKVSKQSEINFYTSIGYNLDDPELLNLKTNFENFQTNLPQNKSLEYSWKSSEKILWQPENYTSTRAIYLNANSTAEIHQILGICGHFLIRTNRFIRTVVNLKDNLINKSYFEI